MASKRKRKDSNPKSPSFNEQHGSFDGDNLLTLLNSFQRVIESERESNKALPHNIWYKMQFAVGVNEVTRLLEGSNASSLQAVLVAADCNPKWLTKHLPSLASSRNVPLMYVKDKKEGSLRLGELVKVKTAIAIGVKVKGSNINNFIQGVLNADGLNETGRLDSPGTALA
ncbi:hypothetical protein vseg_006280 [Gypsophila vaccaria]